jgi:UDP-galactopyranose mutase
LYGQYQKLGGQYQNLLLLGRLAEYQYYNIDGIVAKAMEVAENIG